MNFDKVTFPPLIPDYIKLFDLAKNDKNISKYVSFSPVDSNLIFYENDLAGFYKVVFRDEETRDREIYIALMDKYRGFGLAQYVVGTLATNIFLNDINCKFIHLSIDKENLASIKMAESLGFIRNEELEQELREYNDFHTLIYSLKNRNYSEEILR